MKQASIKNSAEKENLKIFELSDIFSQVEK